MNGPDPAREAAILARCEAATKGPWEWEEFQLEDDRNRSALIHDSVGVLYHQACWRVRDADAAFIAHAREDVPYLLAQLTAARARAERAEGALVEAHDDAAGSWECLMMASEILAAFLGPDHMKGVPPMFYPEAIRSLVYKSARAGILAVFREQATVPTEAEIKRLLQQARALILHQQSDADRAASIPQGAAT